MSEFELTFAFGKGNMLVKATQSLNTAAVMSDKSLKQE